MTEKSEFSELIARNRFIQIWPIGTPPIGPQFLVAGAGFEPATFGL